jgi:hypothetical protein
VSVTCMRMVADKNNPTYYDKMLKSLRSSLSFVFVFLIFVCDVCGL